MQDEVTTRLAHEVHIELIAAESCRVAREHPDRLDSVDHTLHGWAAWYRHRSLESARQARRFFEAALRLDERNVDALLGLADTHMSEVNMYASDNRAGQIRTAEAAATKALTLAPDNANAHVTYGTVLYAMCAPEIDVGKTDEKVPSEEERIARAEPYRFFDMGAGFVCPAKEKLHQPEIGVRHGEIAV